MLLHLVDSAPPEAGDDAVAYTAGQARAIVEELRLYDETLYEKPRWLVLNKLDMLPDPDAFRAALVKELDWKGPVFSVSALDGTGTSELIYALQDYLDEERKKDQAQEATDEAAEEDEAGRPQIDQRFAAQDPRFSR